MFKMQNVANYLVVTVMYSATRVELGVFKTAPYEYRQRFCFFFFFLLPPKQAASLCLHIQLLTPLAEPAPCNLWPLRMPSLDATRAAARLCRGRHISVNGGRANGDVCRTYSCILNNAERSNRYKEGTFIQIAAYHISATPFCFMFMLILWENPS